MEHGLEYYKALEPFWGFWRIKDLIGEGAYGKVFVVEREDFDKVYRSAMKAITIPLSDSEWKSILSEGLDEVTATSYYKGFVKELIEEISLMNTLRGHSNIVSYEDHAVIEREDGHTWDVLMRMELLTPLVDTLTAGGSMDRKEAVKMGIDLCTALEVCSQKNIIHRDIKPENIFISPLGYYKLGDFGIARKLEQTIGGLSKKGTYSYMAPEIYKGEPYGAGVDIYSLGMVLYRMLNKNRGVFLPQYPMPIGYNDKEEAIRKRMTGEDIPLPIDAQDELGRIVCKACAYAPGERYKNPTELKKALQSVLEGKKQPSEDTVKSQINEEGKKEEKRNIITVNKSDIKTEIKQETKTENIVQKYDWSKDLKVKDGIYDLRKKIMELKKKSSKPFANKKSIDREIIGCWESVVSELKTAIKNSDEVAWELYLIYPSEYTKERITDLNTKVGKRII